MKIWMRPLTIFTTLIFIQPYILNAQKVEYSIAIDRLISTVQFFHNGKELRTPKRKLCWITIQFWHQYPGIQNIRLYSEIGYNTTKTTSVCRTIMWKVAKQFPGTSIPPFNK